jgi:transcriptional regulator with XRE-family HTH domain
VSTEPLPEEHRKLEDAEVVVVGGAGLGTAQQFGTLRNLSAALGGELGATRPPVLEHWVDEDRMIGQTGKSIRPNLLISIGTSGAIQYTAGIMESGTIVAVNRDKNAPIFQVADVGVVADAKSFMPIFTAKVKQAVMREIADVWSEGDTAETGVGFGEKVQKLREANDWSQEILAEKTGQSPEFISQVENDEIVPAVSFLLRLSRALDVEPGTFLREEEKAAILDQRAQAFVKRTKNYFYRTLTPGAENEHLRAFMITIEAKQTHKPVAYKHEGEEFVFVMAGTLELTLGNKPHKLKTGESLNFNSEIPHKLKSLGHEETRCLVVLYTP